MQRNRKKPGVGLGYRSRFRHPNLKSCLPKKFFWGGEGEEKASQQRHLKTSPGAMLAEVTTPEYPFFTVAYIGCHIRHVETPNDFCTSVLYSV